MNPILVLALISCTVAFSCSMAEASESNPVVWHDAKTLVVEGRGWDKEEPFYGRYPARAHDKLVKANPSLEWLSSNTAGLVVCFKTNSPEIGIRWNLLSPELSAGFHMFSATGVSGVDLYAKYKGKWHWAGTGAPYGISNECKPLSGLSVKDREFMLYLPLYNGVSSVEIGIPKGSTIEPLYRTKPVKPILFYGSSITHGGCADRPGMTFPSIVGRRLDIPVINLGFGGNGLCEPEVVDLLAEIDPSMYVIDTTNVDAKDLDGRLRHMLDTFKTKHPGIPVLLLQNVVFQSLCFYEDPAPIEKDVILQKVYEDYRSDWKGGMYFLDRSKLLKNDGEATVDGIHPTSLGEMRFADAIVPVVRKAIR